jgi:hypothetical protein
MSNRTAGMIRATLVLCGILLATAFTAAPSYAQEEPSDEEFDAIPPPLEPSEPVEEGEQRVKVAAFIFPNLEMDARVATEVVAGLRRGVRNDARLEYVDPSNALQPPEEEDTPSAEGAEMLERALELAQAGQWLRVVRTLDDAIELFESDLTNARRNDLVDASLLWGSAQCKLRRRRVCESAFRRVVTFRENVQYDAGVYPSDVAPIFEQVRDETLAGARGSLRIESEPPGAEVFVDGRFVGAAPTRAEGLLAGDHYVSLKLPGYTREVHRVTVQTDFEDTATFELFQLENAPLLRDALIASREEMGEPRAGAGMRDLWSLLLIDQVILGDLQRIGDSDRFNLTLYLYDLRTNHEMNHIQQELDWTTMNLESAELLAAEIYRDVDLSGRIQPREEELPPPPEEPTPFYRTWWFWTIAGVVVVGTTVGVASAVAAPGQPEGVVEARLPF